MNTLTKGTHLRGLIAAGILGALASTIAAAGPPADGSDTVSKVVKYGDLNLASPEGTARLYTRIVAAAKDVCDLDGDIAARSQARAKACVHDAIADAVTKVGRPQLVALYNAKNSPALPVTLAAVRIR